MGHVSRRLGHRGGEFSIMFLWESNPAQTAVPSEIQWGVKPITGSSRYKSLGSGLCSKHDAYQAEERPVYLISLGTVK
jgi:hypothetical protein